jgi:hypothetical protein
MADLSTFTSVFSSSSNNNNNRIAKRNRRPLSCATCRDRKLKCDRQQPCSACSKRGDSFSCEYGYVVPQKSTKPRTANDAAASRLQKLEDLVNGLMHTVPMSNFVVTPPHSSTSPQNDTPAYSDVSAGGHLSQRGNHYIGGTHWASILESIHDIRSIMDSDMSDAAPEVTQPSPKADPLFGQEKLITIDQILATLPARHEVDSLVASYFKESCVCFGLINSGKFRKEYEVFWRSPSSASLCWLSILFSIMFMAGKLAIARGQHAPSGLCSTKQAGALRMAAKCLVAGHYLTAQPYSVEALLFHFHCIYALHADPDMQPWPILTMATRLAQKMGYHRDPKHLSSISPFESEMRRRAWYYIEIFDMTMSAHQGIPAMINEDECDVQFPINLLDEDFDEDTVVMPPPRSNTTHIPMLFFTCKAEALRLLRPVVRHSLSSRRYDLGETNRLHESLERGRHNVPPSLRIRTIAETSFVDQDYLIMQRFMLELQFLKGFCILHRPFLGYKKDDPAFDKSREICVNSALRQLNLQTDYYEALQPQGRLYQSRWMFTNITLHEQFAAAMIICLDLNESRSQRYASSRLSKSGTTG